MRENKNLKMNIEELVLLKSKPVDYIEDLLLKSYSHKPYLAQMPYDRNTRNPYKMCARYMALDEYEDDLFKEIGELEDQYDDSIEEYFEASDNFDKLKKEYNESKWKYKYEKYYDEWTIDWDSLDNEKMTDAERDYILQQKKNDLNDWASDHLLMDGGVAMYDPVLDELGKDFSDKEMWTSYADGIGDEYIMDTWQLPLSEAIDFTMETGYCDEAHSKLIDDYISKLESLPIPEGSGSYKQREEGIYILRQIQSNSKTEAPSPLPKESETLLINLGNAERIKDDSKREAINLKRSVHERNVALYEVANEKQNCEDIFSETSGSRESIDDYLSSVDFEQYLNDDRTVKQDFLDAQRQVALDNGDPWFE